MIQTEFRPKVRDILPGYRDDENTDCYAMNDNLCIRPDYQRAFVYDDKKRNLVVDTVQKSMPLGIMYWMKNANTGKYELMDGQQRTPLPPPILLWRVQHQLPIFLQLVTDGEGSDPGLRAVGLYLRGNG